MRAAVITLIRVAVVAISVASGLLIGNHEIGKSSLGHVTSLQKPRYPATTLLAGDVIRGRRKMAAPGGELRVRLMFDYPPPALPQTRHLWFMLDTERCRAVTDVSAIIRERFFYRRRGALSLYLDGCLLPPGENVRLIRDNDAISVKWEEYCSHNSPQQKSKKRLRSEDESDDCTDLTKSRAVHRVAPEKEVREQSKNHLVAPVEEVSERSKKKNLGTPEEEVSERSKKKKKNLVTPEEEVSEPSKKKEDLVTYEEEVSERSKKKKKKNLVTPEEEVSEPSKKKKKKNLVTSEEEVSEPSKKQKDLVNYEEEVSEQSKKKNLVTPEEEVSEQSKKKKKKKNLVTSEEEVSEPSKKKKDLVNYEEEVSERSKKKKKNLVTPEEEVSERSKKKNHLVTPEEEVSERSKKKRGLQQDSERSAEDFEMKSRKHDVSKEPGTKKPRHVTQHQEEPPCSTFQEKELPPVSSTTARKETTTFSSTFSEQEDLGRSWNAESGHPLKTRDGSSSPDGFIIKKTLNSGLAISPSFYNGHVVRGGGEQRPPLKPAGCGVGRGRGTDNLPWRGRGFRGRGEVHLQNHYYNYSPETIEQQQLNEDVTNVSVLIQNPPEAEKKDYSSLPLLAAPPQPGKIVAFKLLELTENYTPEVSDYKEGRVLSYDAVSQQLEVEVLSQQKKKEPGKFDLVYEGEDGTDHVEYAVPQDCKVHRIRVERL